VQRREPENGTTSVQPPAVSRPAVKIAAERGERLVGLAADEYPELGFIGVLGLKDVVRACEDYQVASARAAGWRWAQIGAALEVSPQAVHQKPADGLTTAGRQPTSPGPR
jgi:hypothetical protein